MDEQTFSTMDEQALSAAYDAAKAAFRTATAEDVAPTPDNLSTAQAAGATLDAIEAEMSTRRQAAEQMAAMRGRTFSDEAAVEEPAAEEPAAPAEPAVEAAAEEEPAAAEEPAAEEAPSAPVEAASTTTQKVTGVVSKIAAQAQPEVPAKPQYRPPTIVAAADAPGYSTGNHIPDMEALSASILEKMQSFAPPSGDGKTEDLRFFPVAKFMIDYPDDLTIDRNTPDHMAVLAHAADETRLPGNSLVAAAGWCAPSETLYDILGNPVVDGLLQLPETVWKRGGINFTKGTDFSSVYSAVGFHQTEAQAISGTTKSCYEVPCPSFTEKRLEIEGLCIKVPILLNAAYPEVVQDFVSQSMVAHQYKMNAFKTAAVDTAAGAARVVSTTALGSAVGDSMEALAAVAAQQRQIYRLGVDATLEVILPVWAKEVFRLDLERRNGHQGAAADAEIAAYFGVRKLNVQYIWGWNELGTGTGVVSFPDPIPMIMYPAGTFVVGRKDVINLSAVYDAASLAVNTYTGLFMEEGVAVANRQYSAVKITVPNCSAGRTGAADFTCA